MRRQAATSPKRGGLTRVAPVGTTLCLLILLTGGLCPRETARFAAAQPPSDNAASEPPAEAEQTGGALLEGLDLESESGADEAGSDASGSDGSGASEAKPNESAAEGATDRSAAASEDSPLMEAYLAMREAGRLLGGGEVREPTQAAQQRAIDLLDAMIGPSGGAPRGAPPESSPPPQPGGEQPTQPTASQPGERQPAEPTAADAQPAGQGDEAGKQTGPQPAEAEPNETPAGEEPGAGGEPGAGEEPGAGGEPGDGEASDAGGQSGPGDSATTSAAPRQPLEARGQAVWGHLPSRTRGLLRAEIPTEYLPQYAREISAYFAALAELDPDE